MSQSIISLADGTGNEVLRALNTLFAAVSTLQSGEQEPSTPLPFMLWADTTHSLLKIRNAGNDAWIELGDIRHNGLFLGSQAVTSGKIAPQAVTLAHLARGPANRVLAAQGEHQNPVWEDLRVAYEKRDPVLTARGAQQDPQWAVLPETFDGWQVGDTIHIAMNNPDFYVAGQDNLYGYASADVTINSTTQTSFTFSGNCYMSATDPDLFFNDHFSHSGACTGSVSSEYWGHIDSPGWVQHGVTEHFYWDCTGWVSVRRITDEQHRSQRF